MLKLGGGGPLTLARTGRGTGGNRMRKRRVKADDQGAGAMSNRWRSKTSRSAVQIFLFSTLND